MAFEKIVICTKCGETIVGIGDHEAFIRNRIVKFKRDGTPYVICKGTRGAGKPCKNEVVISKDRMLSLMKEVRPL
jgi:hypothetical protein